MKSKLWDRHFVELMGPLKWDQLMVGLVYLERFTLRLAEENHPGCDFTKAELIKKYQRLRVR